MTPTPSVFMTPPRTRSQSVPNRVVVRSLPFGTVAATADRSQAARSRTAPSHRPVIVIAIERYHPQMDQASRRERKAGGAAAALATEFLSARRVAQPSATQGLEPSPSVRSTASPPRSVRGMRADVPGARG